MSAVDYAEPEQVDAAWLEDHAEARRTEWENTRERLHMERTAERMAMPLHKRLARVTSAILMLTTSKAGSITSSARSADRDYAPPHANEFALGGLHPEVVERQLGLIEKAIEALERAHDEHLGLVSIAATMLSEEKDKRILSEFRGLTPEDVSALSPELGDPLVIRRVRKAAERDPETGERN